MFWTVTGWLSRERLFNERSRLTDKTRARQAKERSDLSASRVESDCGRKQKYEVCVVVSVHV